MENYWKLAQTFLAGLDNQQKTALYNELLKISKIHEKNQNVKHYSLRKIRRATHRLFDDRKQTFHYVNNFHEQITVQQIQEQHLLKTCYKIQISFNEDEVDYLLIENLLTLLKEEYVNANLLQPVIA
ncbi:hypothetical protein M2139_002201 [Enterococcus sp. PF1-24]|uniref:hypothetical protein n=1 Tax=unclassified Enterococcus TaxID=2608891 RepID=UPI002476B689|nr:MULTISPECIES: hypothetical protein [unclassified Enterococcus]MDH6365199.1 hypothetical protein [Enterococcus sp. PFB1-1]MDH6402300.1 hypothetical protein [Enterococcus sp. PF1-24]